MEGLPTFSECEYSILWVASRLAPLAPAPPLSACAWVRHLAVALGWGEEKLVSFVTSPGATRALAALGHGVRPLSGDLEARVLEKGWEGVLEDEIPATLAALVEIRDTSESERNRLEACKQLLDRAGVAKPQRLEADHRHTLSLTPELAGLIADMRALEGAEMPLLIEVEAEARAEVEATSGA